MLCRRPRTNDPNKKEMDGSNAKSGNLNSAIQQIWPKSELVTDRDVMFVLDADQAAFPDFLTKMLPCFDAGNPCDNVALVQSPQVRKHPRFSFSSLATPIQLPFSLSREHSALMNLLMLTLLSAAATAHISVSSSLIQSKGLEPTCLSFDR